MKKKRILQDEQDFTMTLQNQEDSGKLQALANAGIPFNMSWRKISSPSELSVKCPSCDHKFQTETPEPGNMDEVNCPNCGTLLRMESEYHNIPRYDYGMDKGIRVFIFPALNEKRNIMKDKSKVLAERRNKATKRMNEAHKKSLKEQDESWIDTAIQELAEELELNPDDFNSVTETPFGNGIRRCWNRE